MKNVIIYSADYCPFCVRAKNLLDSKGVPYKEVRVDLDPSEKQKVIELTGLKTIPQIFIDNEFIGGFNDLKSLDDNGELDKKLKS